MSMLSSTEFQRIAEVCSGIANEVADDDGFVPVRRLLERFHADLYLRPLLVEAMLAFLDRKDSVASARRWTVLVDSETFSVSELDIDNERYRDPLPSRLRNTIAHELVHSLAFRPTEFGIQVQTKLQGKEAENALVKRIERETEKLSPLLLWSEKALSAFLANTKGPVSVGELDAVCKTIGISRYVLISRFRLLRSIDRHGLLNSPGLTNIGLGIGKWVDGNHAVLRKWPLFVNFERNIVPAFFFKLSNEDELAADIAFADRTFSICGGANDVVECSTDAGTEAAPTETKFNVECSIGSGDRRVGSEFLFVVRKTQ